MKYLQSSVLILSICWCSVASAQDTPATASSDHEMHSMDMHVGHDMSKDMSSDTGLSDMSLDFELLNHQGETVTAKDFLGKNVLLSFGFTQCVHICPLIAFNMANTLKVADKDAIGIFVSVDNERDTPAITHEYASQFGDDMIGLSGSYEQLSAAAKNYNATFIVTKSEDAYTVQHTPSIFLVGPDGQLIDVFAINSAPADIVAAMK